MGKLLILMVVFYLVRTYANDPGIYALPLALHLKESLHLSAEEWAKFQAIANIPWMIKPLWGVAADNFPLFGYSIKSYFLICYSLALCVFLRLSQIEQYTTSTLLIGSVLISFSIAFSDVITEKLMVVEGKAQDKTAILQAAQWTAAGFGGAVMYLLSGWIAKNSTLPIAFMISAIVPLLGLVATLALLTEKKLERGAVSIRRNVSTLWSTFRSRQFVAISIFIAFQGFSPTPPLLFYERDVLKFAEDFLGILGAVGWVSLGLGAVVFGVFAPKISRYFLLNLIVGLSAISILALALIHDEKSAIVVHAFNHLTSTIAVLGVLEIAARACPTGGEGTTYAFLLSISNFAVSLGSIVGGRLYDSGISFPVLVFVSALFTSLCWFLIPLLKLKNL